MPKIGDLVNGKVVRITDKGAFVEFDNRKSGFLHISEISEDYVRNVNDHLKVGQEIQVRIIAIDKRKNRTSLSIKRVNDELHKKIQFESKMKKFLTESGEKLKQIQKSTESKQGVRKKINKKK